MAILTVSATPLGCYSSRVVAMTVVGIDEYHVLHGLGVSPQEIYTTLRSTNATIPLQLVLGSYDATIAYFRVNNAGTAGAGQADLFFRRVHAQIL